MVLFVKVIFKFLFISTLYVIISDTNHEYVTELFEKNKEDAQFRWRQLKRIAEADFSNEVE